MLHLTNPPVAAIASAVALTSAVFTGNSVCVSNVAIGDLSCTIVGGGDGGDGCLQVTGRLCR